MRTYVAALMLTGFAALALVAVPTAASAGRRTKDYPNSGYCKSGKHVRNITKCRENGGRK
jgi:hypothetical protein